MPSSRMGQYSTPPYPIQSLSSNNHFSHHFGCFFEDIPLSERVRRVNAWCRRLGKDHVVLVSIHVDAAGSDGQWHNATGWSCYTSPGQTAGDRLADCFYRAADKHLQGHKIRTDYSNGDADKEAHFALLTRTSCAAALTENGYQDSKESLAFLESPAGKKAVIGLHVEGIIDFLANILPG
ncbi:MAG: N-acetylmuramoyl-L-alanine amidase [Bacteroidales bacterium]|nr:N-acetylmuramoyl-L-alanine amidase [Bacteroidales bacterium]